jgi:hypothetical protein
MSPQALSPTMLREATRGSLPVLVKSAEQHFITVGMDVTAATTKDVKYDLLDATGNTLLSGRAPLPSSGAPLLLLLPADELGQGRYTLIVRNPDPSGATLGEYSFEVAH